MPKYLCDVCDVHLNFDSQSGRKQHNRGRKHQENVRGYYQAYAQALAHANRIGGAGIGRATITGGITLVPPLPPSAGGLTRLGPGAGASSSSSSNSFHPYATSTPLSIRTLGPGPGAMPPGRNSGPPPSATGYQTSSYRPPMNNASYMPPPPPPSASSAPAPSASSSSSSSTAPPPPLNYAPSNPPSDGGAPKVFVNPERARALGLQSHH